MKPFLILTSLITFSYCLFAQEKFNVTLSFPKELDLSKLTIKLDNGFGRSSVPFKVQDDNQIKLSDVYYSRYAAIILFYPKNEHLGYGNFFFLGNQPGSIKFSKAAKNSSPFDDYSLYNAYDFKKERDSMNAFIAPEFKEETSYVDKYDSLIFDGKHNDLQDRFFELDQNVYKKIIEYTKKTSTSYFSFWYYRSNAQYSGLKVDALLSIFDRAFPDNLKKTVEGNAFRQLLLDKLESKKGYAAAVFTSKDVNGRRVDLSSFKHKKYVLLDFWATWCGPCIKKMPLLASLREKFHEDLEIISIAYPTTLSETKEVIQKQKMDWINIYDDRRLINSYGGMGAIPKLILIDKGGKIIYASPEEIDADSKKLEAILEQNLAAK